MSVFDFVSLLQSLSSENNSQMILFVFLVSLIASIISILHNVENIEMVVGWRRRNELWHIFKEYEGVQDLLSELFREFNSRAGFDNGATNRFYFWLPLTLSVSFGVFAYLYWNLNVTLIGLSVSLLWSLEVLFSPVLLFMNFNPRQLRNLASFLNFTMGSFISVYASVMVWFSNNFEDSIKIILVDSIGFLLVLFLFNVLQKRAIVNIWNDPEFLPKKKVYLQKFPLVKTITTDGQFEGKLWDIFNNKYLILKNGPKEIVVPWSKISYLEIFGKKKTL